MRYLIRLLAIVFMMASAGTIHAANKVETEGVVRPLGLPQEADVEEAREKALRSAWLSAGKKLIRDAAELTLFNARVDKMTRAELEEGVLSAVPTSQARRRGYYRVRMLVDFKAGSVEALAAGEEMDALKEVRERRIMVVIPEQHIGRPVPDPAGETEVIRRLLEGKFRVVDQKQVAKIRQSDAVKAAAGGASAAELLAIAQSEGCEYLLVGEAFSHELPRSPAIPTNMRACQARVEARLFAVDTGDILAAHGLEATEMAPSELIAGKNALRSAGGKVAGYFIDQLVKRMESKEEAAPRVQFVLGGVTFNDKEKFKLAVSGIGDDILSVRDVKFARDRAEIEVRSYLSPSELTSAVYTAVAEINMALEIEEASAGRVVVRLPKATSAVVTPPDSVPVAVNPPREPDDAAPLSADELEDLKNQRWIALVIGLNDYGLSGGAIPSLTAARTDAEALIATLRDDYRFEVRSLLDREATISGIQSAFEQLAQDLKKEDNVLIYYAGHGHLLPGSSLGLWNVADSKVPTDGVYNAQIKEFARRLKARRVLLASDSCYSGDFLQRALGRPTVESIESDPETVLQISAKIARNLNPSREVITSGNLAPVPDTSADGFCAGHSPFACAMLAALEQVPPGGALSTTDLFSFLYLRMEKSDGFEPQNAPQKGALPGHQNGEFFFVRFN